MDGYVLISSQRREYEQGTTDEPKNNLGLSFPLMIIKGSVTHLLRALMIKCNEQSNSNK